MDCKHTQCMDSTWINAFNGTINVAIIFNENTRDISIAIRLKSSRLVLHNYFPFCIYPELLHYTFALYIFTFARVIVQNCTFVLLFIALLCISFLARINAY